MNKQVSFDDEPLILVDEKGQAIGTRPKLDCHLGPGILHRAFSVFVFNGAGEVLLQKRGAEKMLWPSFWSNSCCSHPRFGETEEEAVHRRISEELGIKVVRLNRHFDFEYRAAYKDIGCEWERCSVFTARSDEPIRLNRSEIEAVRWVTVDELSELLETEASDFTPWIKLEWERLYPLLSD